GFDHGASQLVAQGEHVIAQDNPVFTRSFVVGRKVFYDANNRDVSSVAASVACSSCHLEGRDDGHVWEFPDGPRQTPTLAGRGIPDTAPFHWSGEFADMQAFMTNVVTERMGGKGLNASEAAGVAAFMGALPAPENPYLRAAPTPEQQHGAELFVSAGCGTCH